MTAEPTTTVIVARTVRNGRRRDAQAWLEELVALAGEAPGFVHSNVQEPGPDHPDEVVVVYEFVDKPALDAWLTSPARQGFVAQEAELFQGLPRQQVLATPALSESVTAIASFALKEDTDEAFDAHFQEIVGALHRFEGFIRCELLRPVPGVQDETIIIFAFRARPDLDRWLKSTTRAELLEQVKPLLATERTVNVVGGFAGWFDASAGATTKTWKQATLVLAALYPTALLAGWVRNQLLPDLNFPLAVLVGNVAGVIILSWFLMPWLTRRFQRWLRA